MRAAWWRPRSATPRACVYGTAVWSARGAWWGWRAGRSSEPVVAGPFCAFVNHLLAPAAWARPSLAEHAGKVAVFDLFPLRLAVAVDTDGMLHAAPGDAEPAVT